MLIGITCDHETITDSRGCPARRYITPEPYVRAVARTGATPVLLPHTELEQVDDLLGHLDGLVITGGDFDVPPPYYGEETRSATRRLVEERSGFERSLCRAALRSGLPLLGVCGGMQLLNVVLGGTLYQDLSERPNTLVHEQPHDRRQPHHAVKLTRDSRLQRICATDSLEVNSTHHQILHDLGTNVMASAIAPDGVVEGIEVSGRGLVLGVQWHPELLDAPEQQRIYAALVESSNKTEG